MLFSFAAVPALTFSNENLINVFRKTPTELMCPFSLGNLRRTLVPYLITWQQTDGEETLPVQLMDSDDRLSSENTILTVSINDSTASRTYQCALDLKRCDLDMNTTCNATLSYKGPLLQFQIFGKELTYCDSI